MIGGETMKISYKKLWVLMLDLEMKKGELRKKAQLSPSSMAKLSGNKKVTLDVLMKVCEALDCNLGDIAEFIPCEKI
jgi:DNA-binding Xre family transcriptional regulator